jgi:uncharacterized membrane protein
LTVDGGGDAGGFDDFACGTGDSEEDERDKRRRRTVVAEGDALLPSYALVVRQTKGPAGTRNGRVGGTSGRGSDGGDGGPSSRGSSLGSGGGGSSSGLSTPAAVPFRPSW